MHSIRSAIIWADAPRISFEKHKATVSAPVVYFYSQAFQVARVTRYKQVWMGMLSTTSSCRRTVIQNSKLITHWHRSYLEFLQVLRRVASISSRARVFSNRPPSLVVCPQRDSLGSTYRQNNPREKATPILSLKKSSLFH